MLTIIPDPSPIPVLRNYPPFRFDFNEPVRDANGRLNPFHYDNFRMGMDFSANVMIMMHNHANESAANMILVNKTTGERVKIDFPANWQ